MGNNKGFTLLETMIAIAIMVLAFASILMVESGSINASQRAHTMNIVSMLARNRMIETESEIRGKTFDEVKKDDEGTFPSPYEDYRWTTKIDEVHFPTLDLTGGGGGSSGGNSSGGGGAGGDQNGGDQNGGDQSGNSTDITDMMTQLVTQYLSQAVREVTVTIFWKKGKGEQQFSVSTYWVDLNHEFQISQ